METTRPGAIKLFLDRYALTLKMLGVILLVLLLLIPMEMIRGIVRERRERRDQVVREITSTWGGEQMVVGPVLAIPYTYSYRTMKEKFIDGEKESVEVTETATAKAYFLPSELNIEGSITPSRLHRGIYEAVVYEGQLSVGGMFAPQNFAELDIQEEHVQWDKAEITLAVSDLRGIEDMLTIQVGQQSSVFRPGCQLKGFDSGVTASLPNLFDLKDDMSFQMALNLKGSSGIRFAPVGRQNKVKLSSPWSAPSFRGAFLPGERTVGQKGFEATWAMSWYGRQYPQQSDGRDCALQAGSIMPSLFGVDFIVLIDNYRMVERAAKYAILFFALIFTAFFLFEILSKLRIQALQYILVGAALSLFYLAVLSLSEFVAFGLAYLAGAVASSLLVVVYSLKVLAGGKRTAIIAIALASVYSYLYIVLQLQDYSLLFGTAGLFVALAIVMYCTRDVDWTGKR